jgi:hypothetical protein
MRARAAGGQLETLLNAMRTETLSPEENVNHLRSELAELYGDNAFLVCSTMGDILATSLQMLETYPVRKTMPTKSKVRVIVS